MRSVTNHFDQDKIIIFSSKGESHLVGSTKKINRNKIIRNKHFKQDGIQDYIPPQRKFGGILASVCAVVRGIL